MSRINSDLLVTGNLRANTFTPPAGSITDPAIAGAAGSYVNYQKLQHLHRPHYSQTNSMATSETKFIHSVFGLTASVVDFRAGLIAVCTGNAYITIDLRKNGTSILSAPIVLDSSAVPRVMQVATIATEPAVEGDWFDVVVTANVGTGYLGTGVGAQLTIEEDPV